MQDSANKTTQTDGSKGGIFNSGSIGYNSQKADNILIPKIGVAVQSGATFKKTPEQGSRIPIMNKMNINNISNNRTTKKRLAIKTISIFLAVFLVFFVITGILFGTVYKEGLEVKGQAQKVKESLNQKDLNITLAELKKLRTSMDSFEKSYKKISYMKAVPFAGIYYKDGERFINVSLNGLDAGNVLLESVIPYADIIGYKGTGEVDPTKPKTAQDKIDLVIKTIPDIVPKIDTVSQKVSAMRSEMDRIDPGRYPKEMKGMKVRENLEKTIRLLDSVDELIVSGKPLLQKSDYFLGVDSPRTYLVLLQNDKELRPTGGFITAYTIARVDKGRFDPIVSDDIYNLDDRYKPSIKAPDEFPKYLKGIYVALNKFRLRDMNYSPDFEVAMDTFSTEVKKTGIDNFDGIIAVDTQMLVNLLEVLGKVNVPGFGSYTTEITPECNCAQVVYELEKFADTEGPVVWSENEPGKIVYAPENYGNRKGIIGPLMNVVLSDTLNQPDEKMPALFEAAMKSLTEKHVLFYFLDDEAEKAVKAFGVAGEVKPYEEGDYLYINDANLGGRKSNLYVTQEVVADVVQKDGKNENTVTITYKNPEKYDGWLNSVLPNWIRIYVPKGSSLIEYDGFEEFTESYEEFGKTVFAGFVQVRPEGVAKVMLKYSVPVNTQRDYKILIQKQPGKDAPMYTINFGKKSDEFLLNTDKEIRI